MASILETLRKWKGILETLEFGAISQGAIYGLKKPYYDAKYTSADGTLLPRPRSFLAALLVMLRGRPTVKPRYEFVGNVTDFRRSGQAVDFACTNAHVRIEVLAEDLMRVRLSTSGEFGPLRSYALAKTDWPAIAFSVDERGDAVEIRTARLVCRIAKQPCRISFFDPSGVLVNTDHDGMGWSGPRVVCSKQLGSDEHLYGLGEKTFGLERRGRKYTMWNSDPAGYDRGHDPIYQSIPFLLGLRYDAPAPNLVPRPSMGVGASGRAYGIFFDNTFRSTFDLGATRPNVFTFGADGGELRYYFFYGPALSTVLERYTELTGRMELPPRWVLGYHQSRWSYASESEVRAIASEFRRRRIPCDAIYFDIGHTDGYRCFTWHPRNFPRPRWLIADLREQGFKTVTIIDPGIKTDPGYSVYDDGLRNDVFCKLPDGKIFHGPVWPGSCCFPDFTNPRVRAWWGDLHRGLVEDGVAGFWDDMNEPSVFGGGTMPDAVQHDNDGRPTTHRECHNVYGMLMTRATYEGLRALQPNRRPLVITRSAFAGTQRYAMTWTADNRSTWDHLRLSIAMCLSEGLSGLAFVGPDIGGFAGDCDGELFTRWTQIGALLPFFRAHTAYGTQRQEPWSFGERYEAICRRFIELRYELLPYLYTAFWQCATTGLPMMRPLVMAYQDDPAACDLDDEFLLGDAILAAPVCEPGVVTRSVHLPRGTWYNFWSGNIFDGGRAVQVEASLEMMPIFVRAGSVVPLGPVMQFVGERLCEPLTLRVYPGEGESLLYEDDGESFDYQSGAYQLTRFTCRGSAEAIELRIKREGAFAAACRRFNVVIYGVERQPKAVVIDGEDIGEWEYDGTAKTVRFMCGLAEHIVIRV